MRAVHIATTEPPGSLKSVEVPLPVPDTGEILVRVHAAGVNFADILARKGLYPDAPPRPFVPGYEVAGTVEKCGAGAVTFSGGDRVLGFTHFGGYAEYAVCREEFVRPLKEPLSFIEGASIPVNWLTAFHSIFFTGPLERGFTVFVHSAAGGVGTAAVQLLKHSGCIVIGAAGSAEKLTFLSELGVDLAINSRREDFSERVLKERGPGSVDIILDPVGGETFRKEWKLLRAGGRIVTFGVSSFARKNRVAIAWSIFRSFRASMLHLMGNSHGVYGVNMLKIFADRPDLAARAFDRVMELTGTGAVRPVVDSVYPLSNAAEAHARLESRKSIGKVILVNDCN